MRFRRFCWCLAIGLALPPATSASLASAAAVAPPSRTEPMERYEDPPGIPATLVRPARALSSITFNGYTSIQVNVNPSQQDIVGDAANEPSIAVDPDNHNRMLIGWRQFDTISSNFRQAGFGFSSDGGATWTTGKINAGVFRSDPVLDFDGSGHFAYNSLRQTLNSDVFKSSNGTTWSAAVAAFGGDKQWMKIDRGLNNFYQAWSTASNNYAPNTFNKSIDDGATFGAPDSIPNMPIWGTLDVALDHTLYLVGLGDNAAICDICVERSSDAQKYVLTPPTFTYQNVDLGGEITTGGPNPVGLLGQLWIAVDRSSTLRSGWVYVLASVVTPTDPVDIHFVRSMDNGQTWSAPVRVNDDPTGNRAFQWFGTMSVSPSGRIDAIWNDTRGSADSTLSALFYSYSLDGGVHWSANVQVTPTWYSTVGWPNQQKIGDYYTTVSDNAGVDVAYSATFRGGQDVYYLRIPNAAAVAVDPGPAVRTRLTSAPNPFTTSTRIRFDAPAGERARVEVLDIAGRHVATLFDRFVIGAGQSVTWDGRRDGGASAPAGVYLCRLEASGRTETHKLLRLK